MSGIENYCIHESNGILQEAAGVWVLLRDGASLKVEQPRPIDISPECAAMLEKLCLAQAQECTFEKARMDAKKPAILARSFCIYKPLTSVSVVSNASRVSG